jgi:DNA-binding transcriptional MerR regulator
MLRYYEQQGLLASERHANGYRAYPPSAIARVQHIKQMLDSGFPTRVIAIILEMEDGAGAGWKPHCDRDFADTLLKDLEELDERIEFLLKARTSMRTLAASLTASPSERPPS